MNRMSVLRASGIALLVLMVWWIGIPYLDGALGVMLPYDQYEMVALLYPDIYYPALPGWILAHAQPYSLGVVLVAASWMTALSVIIGAAAAKYAVARNSSPAVTATAFVIALFIAVTVLEAAATLLA